jgi:hypothetical protein
MSRNENHHVELSHEWGEFLHAWHATRAVWKDNVATQFAHRFVQPWETEMPAFLAALEALEAEMQAAHRELQG